MPAGVQARVDATLAEWVRGPWQCSEAFAGMPSLQVDQLQPISGHQLLRASAGFKRSTACSGDGWHPRHLSLAGIEACE
eukprot:7858067-Alexandrium_andersonii.AAC.1